MLKSGQILNINEAQVLSLPVLTDKEASEFEGKGWNLPNVWDLPLLKKVYIEISKLPIKSKENLYKKIFNHIKANNPERLIDEYWNALICFKLISYTKPEFTILKENFFESTVDYLTPFDTIQLRNIFFTYYRFKEISNWFLKNHIINRDMLSEITEDNITSLSSPLFCTSVHDIVNSDPGKKRHLSDTIFYETKPTKVYQLNIHQDKIMRFFDVFINWGLKINLIERLNLTDGININCNFNGPKRLKAFYFINDNVSIDIKKFIDDNYKNRGRAISIPELTINIALTHKCSIHKIHEQLILQTASNGLYSLQRTSKVFISKENGTKSYIRDRERLYPKLGNAFISHIILR